MTKPVRTLFTIILGAVLLASLDGCAPPIQEERLPALDSVTGPIARIALTPIRQSAHAARPATRPDQAPPEQPSQMLETELQTGLSRRGVTVMSSRDFTRSANLPDEPLAAGEPTLEIERARAQHLADALVSGEVTRFEERLGGNLGVERPASVTFRVSVWRVSDGARLWNATFDETQQPISANLLNFSRYPGNGTRWLSAEELLRWGADDTAARLPIGP